MDNAIPAPHHAPAGFVRVVAVRRWNLLGTLLTVVVETSSGEEATIHLEVSAEKVWHFRFIPPGAPADRTSPLVIGNFATALPLAIEEDERTLRVKGGSLTATVTKNPWSLSIHDPDGSSVWHENPADVDGLGRPFVLPLGYALGEGKLATIFQSFHLGVDEHLFGLGEKFTSLDKTRQRIISWSQDAFGSTSERSHKNIPFFLSTKGYGFFVPSSARMAWDLGTVSCQSATVAVEDDVLEWYLFRGDTPAAILFGYSRLTGFSPVPPKWSFGLWVSSGGTYRDRAAMERLVEGLDAHGIPADVVHVDPWWMRWRKYCDFVWNEDAFPYPQQFIDTLHARGLRLCLWEHPYLSVESELFSHAAGQGYLVKRADGSVYVIDYGLSMAPRPDGVVRTVSAGNSWNARVAIIDLTLPAAWTWFKDLHRPLLRMGVDLFKTDFGEDVPPDALFSNGETGRTMHNLYPLLYNRAVFEVTREERGEGVVWGRAGTAGSQQYPVCWSGDPAADFESLACTIRGGLSIGMSGVPFWSNDIGGYRGMPDPELYVRWAQFGLFCSHSRMHGDSPREPWHFGEQAAAIVRKHTALRYQLFPYLYSTAHEAARTGMPVIRALPLAFPEDPNTYDKDFEFMLGPWILTAPVYERGRSRSVYLPHGRWVDIWTDAVHEGGRVIRVEAPLDILPLFVREGAILPKMLPANRIPETIIDPLLIEAYPSPSSSYLMYDDAGTTRFDLREEPAAVELEWMGTITRGMIASFHNARRVRGVEAVLDGTQCAVEGDIIQEDGTILIRLPRGAGGRIILRF